MSDWKQDSYVRRLENHVEYFVRWSDKAVNLAEKGEQDFGVTWLRMASEKADDIRGLLDEAEREGVEIPSREKYEVGVIPTRYKLREEVSRLQAHLGNKDVEMAEVRKHLAKECVSFVQARKRLEFELHTLQWLGVVAAGVALLGWLR